MVVSSSPASTSGRTSTRRRRSSTAAAAAESSKNNKDTTTTSRISKKRGAVRGGGGGGDDSTTTTPKRTTTSSRTKQRQQQRQPQSTTSTAKKERAPPTRVLIIDNGGDTIKYGWSDNDDCRTTSSDGGETLFPKYMPNATARLQQQWTILVGDQIYQIQNPNSLIGITRSTERGMIVHLGNQIQVWKRILDLLGIIIPLTTSDTAKAFGWKKTISNAAVTAAASGVGGSCSSATTPIASSTCGVLIGIPPHCPRLILDQIMCVWMEDFGFANVGFVISSACCATNSSIRSLPSSSPPTPHHHDNDNDKSKEEEDDNDDENLGTCCVVDLGYSAIHVIPTYHGKIINSNAIRRMSYGGRHLINMWKYYVSYRQWNLMDQEWILRDAFHKTAYISTNFKRDMKIAKMTPPGRRSFDRELVLPDYHTKHQPTVRLPFYLQRNLGGGDNSKNVFVQVQSDDEDDDEEGEDMDYEDKDVKGTTVSKDMDDKGGGGDGDGDNDNSAGGDDSENDDDDDDESPEEIRRRVLKQRQEEELRRRELEAEQQVLNISVERFAIPEVLFRPSDAGLPAEWAGLPECIMQSIEGCSEIYQAALCRSIVLVGGLSKLPHLKKRLERELRTLVPCHYDLKLTTSKASLDQAWMGMRSLSKSTPYTTWSVDRDEWESSSRRGAWKKLLQSNGGFLI